MAQSHGITLLIAIDIAVVRQEGTIAGRLFRLSPYISVVPSWASISRQFLSSKDIFDWPTWVSRRAAETGAYKLTYDDT